MTSNQVTQMIKLLTLKKAQNYGLLGAYGHWIGHVGCLACHKLQPNVDDNLIHTGVYMINIIEHIPKTLCDLCPVSKSVLNQRMS